ncbi:RecX family transcriptional regulator [Novosphingobium sp. 1949]|uniref:RecX family transcriptional regulator n=1 Tax=Novosphingobium organovorum TaxID=2930092 RepID=A0ABT0BJB2_9SPHN|nr:RecX family transcriptional regulator [Novosphingobium organovorum]MCJ2184906.1 RecX family transcriptional regulator [Novosphingobium organovorum]
MSDKRRNPRPLNRPRLEEMALAYVARFATTQAKLRDYLRRKLRERGWEGEDEPPLDALVERYAELGYVDDEGWARMKAGSLLRRGYGARRVSEALGAAGVDEDVRGAMAPGEAQERESALALARRRRLGPFAREEADRAVREKHLAAMLRAGHRLEVARRIIEAEDATSAQEWVDEAFDRGESLDG